MVSIKGLHKTTLLDFPGCVACTVFISTCNFRCPFCHNESLVKDSSELKEFSEKDILDFLEKRKGLLDGVCITGGEPLLYPDIKNFIKKIRDKGFKIKLDTNGSFPERLRSIIDEKLIDYIAMDIKSSKEKYQRAAGAKVDLDKIQESIDMIRNSGIDYEFRTTILPAFFDKEDAKKIGGWLKGSKKYVLQQFILTEKTLDPEFMDAQPYDKKELENFKAILDDYFDEVDLRI